MCCLSRSRRAGLSLVVVIYKVAFPRITQLGRLPGTNIYRSILMYPEAETTPGVLVLRIDAAIQFFCCEASAAAVQPGHFEMMRCCFWSFLVVRYRLHFYCCRASKSTSAKLCKSVGHKTSSLATLYRWWCLI